LMIHDTFSKSSHLAEWRSSPNLFRTSLPAAFGYHFYLKLTPMGVKNFCRNALDSVGSSGYAPFHGISPIRSGQSFAQLRVAITPTDRTSLNLTGLKPTAQICQI
jgi:hypothetical protein